MIRGVFLQALLWLAITAPGTARAERFALDPVHTRVAFQVSHAGFSWPVGSFSQITGVLDFDREDWSRSRVEVRIPIATLQLGDRKWQDKMLDPTWFDADRFPEAHFVSTKVEAKGSDEAEITGELTLHGVTRPLTLRARLNRLARHPLNFKYTAGFSATGTLSRKDFGIDNWGKLVGDEVRLLVEVEATRDRDAGDGD